MTSVLEGLQVEILKERFKGEQHASLKAALRCRYGPLITHVPEKEGTNVGRPRKNTNVHALRLNAPQYSLVLSMLNQSVYLWVLARSIESLGPARPRQGHFSGFGNPAQGGDKEKNCLVEHF